MFVACMLSVNEEYVTIHMEQVNPLSSSTADCVGDIIEVKPEEYIFTHLCYAS